MTVKRMDKQSSYTVNYKIGHVNMGTCGGWNVLWPASCGFSVCYNFWHFRIGFIWQPWRLTLDYNIHFFRLVVEHMDSTCRMNAYVLHITPIMCHMFSLYVGLCSTNLFKHHRQNISIFRQFCEQSYKQKIIINDDNSLSTGTVIPFSTGIPSSASPWTQGCISIPFVFPISFWDVFQPNGVRARSVSSTCDSEK